MSIATGTPFNTRRGRAVGRAVAGLGEGGAAKRRGSTLRSRQCRRTRASPCSVGAVFAGLPRTNYAESRLLNYDPEVTAAFWA